MLFRSLSLSLSRSLFLALSFSRSLFHSLSRTIICLSATPPVLSLPCSFAVFFLSLSCVFLSLSPFVWLFSVSCFLFYSSSRRFCTFAVFSLPRSLPFFIPAPPRSLSSSPSKSSCAFACSLFPSLSVVSFFPSICHRHKYAQTMKLHK